MLSHGVCVSHLGVFRMLEGVSPLSCFSPLTVPRDVAATYFKMEMKIFLHFPSAANTGKEGVLTWKKTKQNRLSLSTEKLIFAAAGARLTPTTCCCCQQSHHTYNDAA